MAADRGGVLIHFLVLSFVILSLNVSFGSCKIEEVARTRKNYATQIGTYDDNTADRALDGDTNPDINRGHCAQPHDASGQKEAWWMVDLGSEYAIYNVTIYSEDSGSNEHTLGYISVRVSDSADISEHTVTDQCALWDDDKFPKESHETLVCGQVMYGRYVSIQRTRGENPHNMILCEVKVMGERTYDTICANCNDDQCEQTAPCSECLGYTAPACREVCDSNKYGINCQQDCSSHCQGDKCDSETGHCECDPGYYGDKCEQECSRHCKDGICNKDTGYCECESGYYGDKCEQECSRHCKDGICNKDTGYCECESGYYGDKCEQECNRYCKDDICNKATGNCECESSYYGENCDRCSEGCKDTCNSDTGRCICKDWWDGSKCDTEVVVYEIPRNGVTFTDITDSNVVVTWRTIRDLPDNLKQYYSYVLGYRVDGESEWTVVDRTFQHDPGAEGTQQYRLTGLQYNTDYEVQVWSVRSLGNLTERTEDTPDAGFTTKCRAPEKPTEMKGTHEQDGDKVTVTVTWKAPDPRCTEISDNDIEYRLKSEADWQSEDLSSSATSATLSDLDPGVYKLRLTVTNNEGLKSSDNITYLADPGFPSLAIPQNAPTLTNEGASNVTIRWKKIPNVPVDDHYQYVIEYKEEASSSWVEWQTKYSHDPSSDQHQEATLTGLTYNTAYEVRVKSYGLLDGQRKETGFTEQKSFKTKCKAPSVPQNVAITPDEDGDQVTQTVTWEHPEVVGCNSLTGYVVMYRLKSASDDDWTNATTLSSTATSHTLQLDNRDYVVRVEVTNDGGSSGNSNYTEVAYNTSDPGSGGNEGLIAGVVVGVLILVALLVILAFLLYRRRQPNCVFNRKKVRSRDIVLASHLELPVKELSETDSYEEMDEASSPPSTKKKPRLPISINSLASRIGKLKPRNVETAESSKPVIPEKPEMTTTIPDDGESADDFDAVTPAAVQIGDTRIRLDSLATYIKDKKNEKDGFKNEYCVLKKDLQYPCVEGEKDNHRLQKNRYRNIIAYDHSRVVLDLLEGDPNSSYVNACYISGYNDVPKEYVASQGPRKETVDDFWRMIWLLNSNCIVMVTMLIENTKEKCAQYWPAKDGQSHRYHDIKVETRQEEHFADYIVRIFAIEKEGETRTIQQFHFTSWVDRSVPEHTFPLLHFRRKVMAFSEQRTGPLVVHCSAGVGRTGTFIAIDYLDKEAEAEGHVDVRSCVAKMRTQRPNMVQTLPQYVFVHESILELCEIGNTAIPCDQLEEKYKYLCNDSGEYANTSKLQEQFELLNQQRIVPVEDEMAAVTAENKSKNRCRNILPSDLYRPYLSSWQGQSDYINAVYIDSYRKRDMYIVTQTPMPETLTDFWRLVFEHNCNTIIMMENVDDSDQTVATYWPELVGTKQENGPLTIELLGEDTSGKPGLVTREFEVAPTKKAKKAPSKVKQFQLTAWEGDDQLTTNLQKEILNLIEKVEAWQAQAPKGPVLVHCVNGASRSGLFCAANYLIDMIKTEQEVDVFYVVRHIRAHRPQLVDSLEQYQFLHELALTYMTQYATYANYTGGN